MVDSLGSNTSSEAHASKNRVQADLDAKDVPANVLSNCKRLRDQRRRPELVRDKVTIQLEMEVKIIEESRQSLKDHLLDISHQLCILEESQKQIRTYLHDKEKALQIDGRCLLLTSDLPHTSFKPNPAIISAKELSVNDWETFNLNNNDHIEADIRVSVNLRQAAAAALNMINGEMLTQRRMTDFAFHQLNHSYELAIAELKWQLDKVRGQDTQRQS
uniref:tektin-2 n=1 Tax=Myxine glutinosa TaxID=7769 RepID=UPI00358EB5EA